MSAMAEVESSVHANGSPAITNNQISLSPAMPASSGAKAARWPNFPTTEHYFTNPRGEKLYAKYWMPSDPTAPIRGILFHCHGFAEYCDHAYDESILAVTQKGVMVVSHDHIGHGRSDGRLRAYIDRFSFYTDDVIAHMEHVRQKFAAETDLPVPPCFILGHSMGGLIAADVGCLLRPDLFDGGVILTAPALRPDPASATPVKLFAARVLSRVVPWMGVGKLQGRMLCSDESALERMKNDPLIYHGQVRARWGAEMLNAMAAVMARASEITAPLLILHGDADLVCALAGSQEFYDTVKSKDKQLVVFKGALHRLMEEPSCKEEYIRTVAEWVSERCKH